MEHREPSPPYWAATLVLYPGVRVQGIIPLGWFSSLQSWPAWAVLGLWFVLQLFEGFGSIGGDAQYGGGVAFFAHIGGFVFGAIVAFIYMRIMPQPPADERYQTLYDRSKRYRY